MSKIFRILPLLLLVGIMAVGCKRKPKSDTPSNPVTGQQQDTDNTSDETTSEETLVYDYHVFDSLYYYLPTTERAEVWKQVPHEEEDPKYQAFLQEEKTAVGMRYTDFTLPTPDEEALSLSDLVGKTDYVLIDFWASWCRPCRELMPQLRELYTTLPEGRLEILGVSLDSEDDKWKGAIQHLGLNWKHVSDLAAWDCEPANTYGIFCIPTLVLINRDGIIIARGCDETEVLAQIQ